jgi:UDPglucose 6-dehydrogenase
LCEENLRIAVCGLGKVGKPILDTLRLKGFLAIGYDSIPAKSEAKLSDAVDQSDAAIFIVPTPSNEDGSFSNVYLIQALERFKNSIPMRGKKEYLYIVSSTTVPGSCDNFRSIVGNNLCYKPEFVRTIDPENVRPDLLNPSIILIGEGCKSAGDRCEEIYRQIADVPVKRMSLIEAELTKITLNCGLTMKISLANQLHLVAEKLGADSLKIMDAVGTDPRIGSRYLNPGAPYGGPCLPRDNRMFRFVAESVGVDACLSEAADKINEAMQA